MQDRLWNLHFWFRSDFRKTYFLGVFFKSPAAGLSISLPVSVKREPWQEQSQVRSYGFHFNAQPKCGQRLAVGVSRPTAASRAFAASCGRRIVREGENTSAYGFSFPCTRSHRIIAEAMEDVIPHLLNPVATYKSVVPPE